MLWQLTRVFTAKTAKSKPHKRAKHLEFKLRLYITHHSKKLSEKVIIEAHITSDKRIESLQKSIVDFLYVFLVSFSRHFWVFILQCVAVDSKPNVGSIFLAALK